ncbi:MAG: type II toxin-antitoxin system RelE/ParE family toxin [Candidatus Jettenia caeni]|nr:type II toxin-antitoxin system RelE/ParE family toxin [Candidatus Jettenia caeni]UJS17566.1 MAG: type II toxin-antitoxin system RelE/ParE family toxin [Candidatus Jettenia sp.]
MGKFKVVFSDKAEKDTDTLTDDDFNRIVTGCKRLEDNPIPDGKHIKKLKGYEDLYRLRIGDYRIIFEWKGSQINIARVLTRQGFGKKY